MGSKIETQEFDDAVARIVTLAYKSKKISMRALARKSGMTHGRLANVISSGLAFRVGEIAYIADAIDASIVGIVKASLHILEFPHTDDDTLLSIVFADRPVSQAKDEPVFVTPPQDNIQQPDPDDLSLAAFDDPNAQAELDSDLFNEF